MQRDSRFFSGRSFPPDAYEVGDYTHSTPLGGHYAYDAPAAPAFGATLAGTKHEFAGPLNGFEVQPSETCPKNFIIFDQTDNKNRIMFHPALAHKFNSPNFDICAAHAEVGGRNPGKNDNHDKYSSSLKEDTEDIDALLSSEEEEEDVVSTGRTPGSWGGSSLDSSCSMSGLKSNIASTQKSASSGASNNERKRERMRKMVKALRGIIPGGDQLDTPAVLDEAVKYLKSLKVEMKQLGIQNFDDHNW